MSYPQDYPYIGSYRPPYQIQLDYFKPHFFPSELAHVSQPPRSSMEIPPFYLPQLPSVFYYTPEQQAQAQAPSIQLDYETIEKELGDGTSQFDPRVNYFHEVSVMAKHHEQLSQKLVELRREVKEITEKQKEVEKVSESENNLASQKKKKRRLASEIYKEYKCPYPNCTKFYGSEVSMNLHIKLKHDGGTKTERENFARSLMLANPESTLMSFPHINFPPGYIETFQKKIIEKKEAAQATTLIKTEKKLDNEKNMDGSQTESQSDEKSDKPHVPNGNGLLKNDFQTHNESQANDKPAGEVDEVSNSTEIHDDAGRLIENSPLQKRNLLDHYKDILINNPDCVKDVQYLEDCKLENEDGAAFLIRIKLDSVERTAE